MNNRSYEECEKEFEKLDFEDSIKFLASCFDKLAHGELMALRSKFIDLAYLDPKQEADERVSADYIAKAIEEVIVYNLRGNKVGLKAYFEARNQELEFVKKYGIGTLAYEIINSNKKE